MTMTLADLRLFQYVKQNDAKLASQIESVFYATKDTIDAIAGCYNNYTMHNTGHSLRVANYMGELACGIDDEFDENIKKYNAFEVTLMILSAVLHDIGMFIRPEDRDRILKNDIPYTNSLTFDGVMSVVNNNQEEAIKEIVRITHAYRINEYINYEFGEKTIAGILRLEDKYGYADDVVEICIGHGEDYDYLKKLRNQCTKGQYTYNLQFISVLLRVADYLDLDSQRTPILWYKMMRIDGFSKEEWEKHFVVHNERKLKKYIGNDLQIFFEGKSSNAKIHRKYLAYVDAIRSELEQADALLNQKNAEEKYLFHISSKVDDCVVTEGFKYSDLRLNLDYFSITDLLMGNNIYGNKQLGLRELVQNAIDACELMKEIQNKLREDDGITPQISILISKDKGYVKIKDTGLGMTLDVVKKHFLNVGRSYYKSNEFKYKRHTYNPIGQFGIGFLACFLLSDNVTVKTKYYNSNEIIHIELEKNSEYVVTNTEETGNFCGTEITLDYDEFFKVFNNEEELITFVQKCFFSNIPITVKDVDARKELGKATINSLDLLAILDRETATTRYEDIECSKYSSIIDGTIRVRDDQRKVAFNVISLLDKKIYLFNNLNKTMEFKSDPSSISIGYYDMLEYAIIEPEAYAKIRASRKSAKNKRTDILVQSEHLYFLFPYDTEYSYTKGDNATFHITVNNVTMEDMLRNSEIPYYEEVVDSFKYYKPVYIADNQYIALQKNDMFGQKYIDFDEESIMFYHKGIWVKEFFRVGCLLPAAFKMHAVINHKGHGIKLDVSRNQILAGRKQIDWAVSEIMLQYLLSKGVPSEQEPLIRSMLGTIKHKMSAN